MAKSKKPFPVVHFEIHGKNTKKQKAFYSKLFNWKIQIIPQMGYGMVDADGEKKSQINGGLNPNKKSFVTFYVNVDDIDAKLAQAKKLGSKILSPRYDMEDMGIAIAMIKAPDGNPIGIMQSL